MKKREKYEKVKEDELDERMKDLEKHYHDEKMKNLRKKGKKQTCNSVMNIRLPVPGLMRIEKKKRMQNENIIM